MAAPVGLTRRRRGVFPPEPPAVVAALTRPGDRLREYGADDRHARFLTRELVPALESELPSLPAIDIDRQGVPAPPARTIPFITPPTVV